MLIPFPTTTTAMGRNGVMQMTALDLYAGDDELTLIPITSRGIQGNCYLRIPLSAIPALIQALHQVQAGVLPD